MKKLIAAMLMMVSALGTMTPAVFATEGCGCKPSCQCADCQCGK